MKKATGLLSVIAVVAFSSSAHATDYLQCEQMRKILGRLEVREVYWKEYYWKEQLKKQGMDDACGAVFSGPGWTECRQNWISSRYKLQGYDYKGKPVYNPALESTFRKIRKVRSDYRSEGCP